MIRATRGGGAGRRSQSAPLGVALVFALVISTSAIVVVASSGAITATEDQISIQRAEKTLTQLDAEMAKVALGDTDRQSIELGSTDQSYQVDSDAGWIKVKRSTGSDPLSKTHLWEITYERGGTKLAYQGGGVWRKGPDGAARMVSPPEFHYRDGTLTLPIIALTASDDGTLDRSASLSRRSSVQKYPDSTETNPIPAGVTVVVKSEYYRAWGEYFEERTEGIVEYDHANNKVELDLVRPIGDAQVENGLAARSSSGKLLIAGAGAKTNNAPANCAFSEKTYSDSYDSSAGTYCGTWGDNREGDMIYGGEVEFNGNGNSFQQGDLLTNTLNCDDCDKYTVKGDVRTNNCVNGPCNGLPDASYGTYHSSADLGTSYSLDEAIARRAERLSDPEHNDNDGTSTISGQRLTGGSPYELGPGTYYLEEIDFSWSETLTLNTDAGSGGDITIMVEDYVDLVDGTLEVQGSHSVEVWVKGEETIGSSDYHFNVDGGHVDVPGRDSTKFTLVGGEDLAVELGNPSVTGFDEANYGGSGAVFEGVIYAPTDPSSGDGAVNMKQADVFGGVVTGDTYLGTQSAIHYDEVLERTQVISPNTKITKVTYLHISVSEVEVDS